MHVLVPGVRVLDLVAYHFESSHVRVNERHISSVPVRRRREIVVRTNSTRQPQTRSLMRTPSARVKKGRRRIGTSFSVARKKWSFCALKMTPPRSEESISNRRDRKLQCTTRGRTSQRLPFNDYVIRAKAQRHAPSTRRRGLRWRGSLVDPCVCLFTFELKRLDADGAKTSKYKSLNAHKACFSFA